MLYLGRGRPTLEILIEGEKEGGLGKSTGHLHAVGAREGLPKKSPHKTMDGENQEGRKQHPSKMIKDECIA